jgi:hypothetical protein
MLRVVEEFTDDDHPSLPGVAVYDTTAETESTHVTAKPSFAKCGPLVDGAKRRKAAR